MGALMRNGVGYSNNDTGVLMRNGINYTGTYSGGGGSSFDTVLTEGQISSESAYTTASFSDISDYEYVFIKCYDTVGGTDYEDYAMIKVSTIPVSGDVAFYVTLHQSRRVTCRITRTSIRSTDYSGSFVNIYADIVAVSDDIFPTT